jgi:glycerophosphoryl diester phosphodiesterase
MAFEHVSGGTFECGLKFSSRPALCNCLKPIIIPSRLVTHGVTALLFLAPLLMFSADLPLSRHSFTVIAHRGNHARAHENTLTAIEHAIAAGVDYVEIDVRSTLDGDYVLMHDSTVDRMTDGHGPVAQMTLAQLQSLHVRDAKRPQIPPDHLPTFNEALGAIKGRINIYLDFKAGERAAVAKAIRDAGVTKQILVYDDAESVEEWRRVAPELPLILSPPENAKTPQQLANSVSKYRVEVLDGSWKGYSREMVEAAKRLGARTWPDIQSALEDTHYFETIIALGFTGAQTDHPEEFIGWLTQQHRR